MSEASGGTWSVVLLGDAPVKPATVRDVLVATLGLNRIDAMHQAKKGAGSGILVEGVPPGAAKAVTAALRGKAVSSAAVADSQLPDLSRPMIVRNADCLSKGLEIVDINGDVQERIQWADLFLLSVGEIHQPTTTTGMKTEVGRYNWRGTRTGKRVSFNRVQPEPEVELWLITRPPFRVWRFREEKMNYDYLGDRLQPSGTLNFRTFLADLLRFAPQARVSTSTESFVTRQKPSAHTFDSVDAFASYTRHQAVLALRSQGELR